MDYISVIGSQVKFRVKDSSQKSKLYLNGDQSVPQAHPQRPKGSKLGQDDKNPAKKSVAGRTLLVAFLQGPTKYLWVSQDALLKQTFVNRSKGIIVKVPVFFTKTLVTYYFFICLKKYVNNNNYYVTNFQPTK